MDTSASPRRSKKRAPQRAVPQSVRRSGKPLFFGWGAHLTHHEREQVKERIAAAIGIVLALLILGVLADGWYNDNVAAPAARKAALNKPLAIVGKTIITTGWYHKVLNIQTSSIKSRLQQYQTDITNEQALKTAKAKALVSELEQLYSQGQSQLGSLPTQVYQELIDNAVILQRGPAVGLKINGPGAAKFFAGVIKQDYAKSLHDFNATAASEGLTPAQLKGLVLLSYYQQELGKVLSKRAATTQTEADVRHILIPASQPQKTAGLPPAAYATALKAYKKQLIKAHASAEHVLRMLEAGSSWKSLALKYSSDGTPATKTTKASGSKYHGGDLGLQPTSGYVAPFRQAANTMKVGTIKIVLSQFGYHVMEVLSRKQVKLSASQISTNQQTAESAWLQKQEADTTFVQKKYNPPASPTSSLGSTIP